MHLQIGRCACFLYEYLVEFSFSPTRLEIDTSAMALNRLLSTEGKSKTSPSYVSSDKKPRYGPDFVDVTSRSRHCHNSTPCWSSWRIWSDEWTTGSSFESWFDCLAFSTPCPTSLMVRHHFLALPSVEGKFKVSASSFLFFYYKGKEGGKHSGRD